MDSPTYDFDLEMQKKFLSLLIYDETWGRITGRDVLRPEYFDSIILSNICKWIHYAYQHYTDSVTPTILNGKAEEFIKNNKLSEDDFFRYKEMISDIYNDTESSSNEFLKEKAIAFARKAAFYNALLGAKDIFDKTTNYEDALRLFKDALNVGSEQDLGLDFNEASIDFLSMLGTTYSKDNMIQTGIPGWDEALGGGFVKDNFHLIGGAPGFGKSKTMAFLAKQSLMRHKRVVFITLELSEVETMANIINSITGLSIHAMQDPNNRIIYEHKLEEFKSLVPYLRVKFFKPATITCDTIQNYIQKLKHLSDDETFKPDVIFVDYLDKLLPTAKLKGNNYDDMGNVGDDLKNLAITFGCPVISGSQLGRVSWDLKGDQVISMASIAESAKKVHLCHSLTTINTNPGEKEQKKARFYLAKSRSGTPGKVIYCDYDLGTVNISEDRNGWDPNAVFQSASVRNVIGSDKK